MLWAQTGHRRIARIGTKPQAPIHRRSAPPDWRLGEPWRSNGSSRHGWEI